MSEARVYTKEVDRCSVCDDCMVMADKSAACTREQRELPDFPTIPDWCTLPKKDGQS